MKRRGTLGSYGSGKSMRTMNRDIGKGGAIGKKAGFAKAMRTIAARRRRRG